MVKHFLFFHLNMFKTRRGSAPAPPRAAGGVLAPDGKFPICFPVLILKFEHTGRGFLEFGRNLEEILPTSLPELPIQLRGLISFRETRTWGKAISIPFQTFPFIFPYILLKGSTGLYLSLSLLFFGPAPSPSTPPPQSEA